MSSSAPCPVHLALSDSLSVHALQRIGPLLVGGSRSSDDRDIERLHVSLQPLLLLAGCDKADVASLSVFLSPAAAAAASEQGVVPMEMEEVIERLEMLSARLLGLMQDLTAEVHSLRTQQASETLPILSTFESQIAIVERHIERVRYSNRIDFCFACPRNSLRNGRRIQSSLVLLCIPAWRKMRCVRS
jgi:hypothetical protein